MDEPGQQPWETEIERSASGAPIHRYEPCTGPREMAVGDAALVEALSEHLRRHLPGEEGSVIHEIVSQTVHVDIHVVPPGADRPFYTLVTSGLAQRPMTQPPDVTGCAYAELVAFLPPDWPGLDGDEPEGERHPFHDEANYWPIRWLKILARFPHDYQTWIWADHTIPNGDPAAPFAPGTRLCGIMLAFCHLLPPEFSTLQVGDRKIFFLALQALHEDEMRYKLEHGAEALHALFDEHNVPLVIDPQRPSVFELQDPKSPRPWWKFW